MDHSKELPKKKIEAFCRKHCIRYFALFGSILRDDFGPHSDVDVLVEFTPKAKVGFFELYDMEQELSPFFGGRKVDLNTPKGLSAYYRDEVLREAEAVYVET